MRALALIYLVTVAVLCTWTLGTSQTLATAGKGAPQAIELASAD